MGFCIVVLLAATIAAFGVVQGAKLPKNFNLCHQSDPKFNECLVANIEDAIRKMKDGSSELGMKPLDPLLIDDLIIGQGNGPVNVQQNFHNVRLHGLTGSKVLSHKAYFKENKFFSQSITPELRLEADYEMHGRVLLLPISGKGPCNITLYNTSINHTITGELFERKGRTFMKVVDYSVTLYPDRMTYNFENLFNGDNRLGNEINKVLNENWEEVFSDVRAGYEKSFGLIFQELANRVYTRVPLKDIYPQ